MEPLRVLRSNIPRTVCFAGELDASTVPAAADVLLGVSGRGDVRLDLSRVSFMGSDGIRLLIQTSRALEGRGRLLLLDPTPRVLRTLRVSAVVEQVPNMLLVPPAPDRPGSAPPGFPRTGRRPRAGRSRPHPLSCDDESIP